MLTLLAWRFPRLPGGRPSSTVRDVFPMQALIALPRSGDMSPMPTPSPAKGTWRTPAGARAFDLADALCGCRSRDSPVAAHAGGGVRSTRLRRKYRAPDAAAGERHRPGRRGRELSSTSSSTRLSSPTPSTRLQNPLRPARRLFRRSADLTLLAANDRAIELRLGLSARRRSLLYERPGTGSSRPPWFEVDTMPNALQTISPGFSEGFVRRPSAGAASRAASDREGEGGAAAGEQLLEPSAHVSCFEAAAYAVGRRPASPPRPRQAFAAEHRHGRPGGGRRWPRGSSMVFSNPMDIAWERDPDGLLIPAAAGALGEYNANQQILRRALASPI